MANKQLVTFSADYIQHNPAIADGRDPLRKLVQSLPSVPGVADS
jgi:predicted SnoaL-like aldol condensation-catalyzing enzyme